MTEIDQLRQQLQQQEKLASLGLLSAGIAHEIQNPLNFVINFSKMSDRLLGDLTGIVEDNAQLLPDADRDDLADIVSSLKENMAQIKENGERAVSIIQGILLMSRGKDGERIPTDICQLVKEYVRLSYHAMRANHKDFNVTFHEHYQEGLPLISVIPQDLSRAVLNVMNNACYAVWHKSQTDGSDYTPEISVSVDLRDSTTDLRLQTTDLRLQTAGRRPQLFIEIADNGEGMTDEVKQRLFENFFTTKPIGQGTGLGMSITRDIIENRHGGKLAFTSQEGKGTTFTFTIPIK